MEKSESGHIVSNYEMKEIKSIYGSVLAGPGDPTLDVRITIVLKENINIHKMQQALDLAVQQCPYVSYKIVKKDGICHYIDNNEKMTVVTSIPEEYETYRGDGTSAAVCVTGSRLDFYFSHGLIDGVSAQWFLNSLLEYYYDLRKDADNQKTYDRYGIDLMEKPLDISDGYRFQNCFKTPIFSFTDERPAEKQLHFLLELDKESTVRLMKEKNAPLSQIIFLYMTRLIMKFYPDNRHYISCKMPINTRGFFGAEESFQNSSLPNMIFQIDPKESKSEKEIISLCKEQKKQQLVRDRLAYLTNLFAAYKQDGIYTDEFGGVVEGLEQDLIISNMEHFPKEISEHMDMVAIGCRLFSGISFYIWGAKDKYFVSATQKFEGSRFIDGLAEIFEENGVTVRNRGQIL